MADLSTRKDATEGSATEDTTAAVTDPQSDDDTRTDAPVAPAAEPGSDSPKAEADKPTSEADKPTSEAGEPKAEADDVKADDVKAEAGATEAKATEAEPDEAKADEDPVDEGPVEVLTDEQVAGQDTDIATGSDAGPAAESDGDQAGSAQDGSDQGGDDALATQVIKPPKPERARPGKVVLALSVLLVLLVAAGVALFAYGHELSSADEDRALALESARSVATGLTTISAQNADAQINALNRQSTGAFRDQISQYSAMFQAVLKQGQVGSSSEITAAGIEKLEGDTANALVTVSATITSAQVPDGQVRPYRLAIALQREGDHWLASNVEFVQ